MKCFKNRQPILSSSTANASYYNESRYSYNNRSKMNIGFVNNNTNSSNNTNSNNNNPNLFHQQQQQNNNFVYQQQQQQQQHGSVNTNNGNQMIHHDSDTFNSNTANNTISNNGNNMSAGNVSGVANPMQIPPQSPMQLQPPQSPMIHHPQSPMVQQPPQSPMLQPSQSPMLQPSQSPRLQPPQSPMLQPPQSPMPPASPHHLNPHHAQLQHQQPMHPINHYNQQQQQQQYQQQQSTNPQQGVQSPLMPPMSPHHPHHSNQSSPFSKQQLPPALSPSHHPQGNNQFPVSSQHNFPHPNMIQQQQRVATTPTNPNSNILAANNSMGATTSPHTVSPAAGQTAIPIMSPHNHYQQQIQHHMQPQQHHMVHPGHHPNSNSHLHPQHTQQAPTNHNQQQLQQQQIHHHQQQQQQQPHPQQLSSPHHLQQQQQQYQQMSMNASNSSNSNSQMVQQGVYHNHQGYMIQPQQQQQHNQNYPQRPPNMSTNQHNNPHYNYNQNGPNMPPQMMINQQQQNQQQQNQHHHNLNHPHYMNNQPQQHHHMQQQAQHGQHHHQQNPNMSMNVINRIPGHQIQPVMNPQHNPQHLQHAPNNMNQQQPVHQAAQINHSYPIENRTSSNIKDPSRANNLMNNNQSQGIKMDAKNPILSANNPEQNANSNAVNGGNPSAQLMFGPNLPEALSQQSEAGTTHNSSVDMVNNSNLSQINSLINSPLTEEEEEILGQYDCRLFGMLKLESVEQIFKRYFLIKAILCYEKRVKALVDEDFSDLIDSKNPANKQKAVAVIDTEKKDETVLQPIDDMTDGFSPESTDTTKAEEEELAELEKKKSKYIQVAKLYLSLGHFYLLIYDYAKALECYQKFYKFNLYKLQNSIFYYGLGLVYFVFGAYKYAIRSFLCALYKDINFQRVNEIHFRLGLIYKELNDINISLKHFKLALIDTSSSLSSVTKAEIKLCIAQLYELNNEHFEAIEKYEDLVKNSGQSPDDSSPQNIDNALKAKAYRHLGWLYFYSDRLSKITLTTNDEKQIDLVAPLKQELRLQQQNQQNQQQQLKKQIIPKQLNRKSLQLTLEYLSKSAQLDSTQNATWYYYGRALACKGNSREAFVSYKNSVNNPEANGDTWCSIGILYYQQKQFMDSLQAFICAIQLDRSHYSAWLNLAILYEQDNQLEEAFKCYKTAIKCRIENKKKQKNLLNLPTKSVDSTAQTESIGLDLEEGSEEFKHLCERTRLLTNYFSTATDKMKEALKSGQPHVLPMLQEAFSLQIPTELRQKIVNSSQMDQHYIGLGINCSALDTDGSNNNQNNTSSSQDNHTTDQSNISRTNNNSNRILTNIPSNTSPSKIQSLIQQQQGNNNPQQNSHTADNPHLSTTNQANSLFQQKSNNANSKLSKKSDSHQKMVLLKPQQIQMMHQLEMNRSQLTQDQLQMLTYLKSQYSLMQMQQEQQMSDKQNSKHNNNNSQNKSQPNLLDSMNPNLLDFDQLPIDLENMMPTMMHDDTTMLQDLNSLLSSQDIADDLRISDDDKGSLDHIFSFTSNSLSNFLTNANNKSGQDFNNEDSNSSETSNTFIDKIKLDSSLTNGCNKSDSNIPSKAKPESESEILPQNDDELLASKLNIQMTAEQILTECESYGVNGIQTNSLLKPGRLSNPRNSLLTNKKKLFFHGALLSKKFNSSPFKIGKPKKDEQYETETKRFKRSDSVKEQNKADQSGSDSESEWSDVDESLPNGVSGPTSSYLKKNDIKSEPGPLSAPSVVLETKRDALSAHLQYFCLSNPISVVRNIGNVLKLDLGLFSSKSLIETDPDHVVEVRTQRQQPSDENWDVHGKTKRVWKCESSRAYTTAVKYAQYQAHSFQEACREEKLEKAGHYTKNSMLSPYGSPSKTGVKKGQFKNIKFGTNVDLSDEKKWKNQLQELAKLPSFMRIISAGNMLSHVGHKIYGVNTLQMYLKVPGCRTPGHQENNNFCSLNLNIGPGDCEWFGVAEKYWPLIEELCEKNDVDYLTGSWWPNLDDIHEAKIPYYRFIQRPGDLVWVNAGCVHWVQSIGWCNAVSWNIGPLFYMQYKLAIERYEWNKLKFYKSIVPMIHLTWNLARNVKVTDRRLYEYVRYVLMQSLKQCQLAMNYIENCGCELKYQARQSDEPAHYCYDCECEVFNILFVSEQVEPTSSSGSKSSQNKSAGQVQHVVHCQACARKRNHLLNDFVMLNQFNIEDLKDVYNQFQLYVPSLQTSGLTSLI